MAAAQAYEEHLFLHADDLAIWVQLGHALKEAGRLGDALAVYEHSARISPDDGDRDTHLLHLRTRIAHLAAANDDHCGKRIGSTRSDGLKATPESVEPALIAERLRQ